MIRPIPSTVTRSRKLTLASIGDSLTMNYSLGIAPVCAWPEVLAGNLRSAGVSIRSRNFGVSGETSSQNLSRIAAMTQFDVPAIATIWTGHNDLTNSIQPATTTSNINAMVSSLVAAGGARIIICSTHFQNFASGGDAPGGSLNATPSTGSRVNLWNAQHNAYTQSVSAYPATQFAWVDLYHWFYLLLAGHTSQAGVEAYYHTATVAGDTHLNVFGNQQVAAAVYAAINVAGWVEELK